MFEFIIYGSDEDGKYYPPDRGMSTLCAQEVIEAYRKKYPLVCHVNIDVALDIHTVPYLPPDWRAPWK